MGQSLIRYSAVACIVAGGLFMGGTGAVAFAEGPADGTGVDPADPGNTQAPEPTATPRGFRIPNWLRLPAFGAAPGETPRVGYIAPPLMNLPAMMESTTTPDGTSTTRQTATVTLPFVIGNPAKLRGRQPAGAAVIPDDSPPAGVDVTSTAQPGGTSTVEPGGNSTAQVDGTSPEQETKPSATTTRQQIPTIDLTSLVPRRVQGPPLTIKNPLRELLAPDVNLDAPITQQLLPTPLVALLNAVAEQVPLAGLVITPVMEFADLVIPMLLSDVVVPTLPAMSQAAVPGAKLPANKSAPFARSELPPAELAPMGMDIFQAPASTQPLPQSVGVEEPQAPPEPPSPDPGVAPLSDPISYRAGYSDYLRNAGMAQITAIAVPGAAAILLFSLGGGFVGYRQARAGHVIRAEGITRFLH